MKKVITIVIIVLIAVGFGYFLFKVSPQQEQTAVTGYNSAIVVNPNPTKLSTPPPFDPATDHYLGDAKAKNVFIEYGDMQCPYCAEYTNTVFVFRYFPLLQHQNTVIASLAAEAAGAQGKFWEMHDLIFAKQGDWQVMADPLSTFVDYAKQVGVSDLDKFKSDVTSKKYIAALQKGEDESFGLNLGGTPTYFYNGHPLTPKTDIKTLKADAEQFLIK